MKDTTNHKMSVKNIQDIIANLHQQEVDNGKEPVDGMQILQDVAKIYLPTGKIFSILLFQLKCKMIVWGRVLRYKLKL